MKKLFLTLGMIALTACSSGGGGGGGNGGGGGGGNDPDPNAVYQYAFIFDTNGVPASINGILYTNFGEADEVQTPFNAVFNDGDDIKVYGRNVFFQIQNNSAGVIEVNLAKDADPYTTTTVIETYPVNAGATLQDSEGI